MEELNQINKSARFEKKYLELVENQIGRELERRQQNFAVLQGQLDDVLESYWNEKRSNSIDEAQLVESVSRERSLYLNNEKAIKRLLRMADSPYFARMDFKTDGLVLVYIGINALFDDAGKCLIFDWRSPIAGMYYDFEPGPASYLSPGGLIAGEITLKRQYKVDSGRLVYFFDSDIRIEDQILQDILSRNADGKMKTVVTSIQREQNKVIRDDCHLVLIVTGPAGSGKTSIALHRAAYLLYKERDTINSSNIRIFSPNHLFNNYIADVLPELGEDLIPQITFSDFGSGLRDQFMIRVEQWSEQMELILKGEDSTIQERIHQINFFSSVRFFELLTKYLDYLEQNFVKDYPDLYFQGELIIDNREWQELFNHHYAFLSIAKRLSKIEELIWQRLKPQKKELERLAEQTIADSGEEVNEQGIKARARIAVRQQMQDFRSRVQMLTNLQPLTLFRRMFDEEVIGEFFPGFVPPPEWEKICCRVKSNLNHRLISVEELAPLLFFVGRVTEFSVDNTVRHVIVDEAQDYSVTQLAYLSKLYPRARWTLLGDPVQTLLPTANPLQLETVTEVFSAAGTAAIRLQKSYRSSYEIALFSQALLGRKLDFDLVIRHGTKPRIVFTRNVQETVMAMESEAYQLLKAGLRTIAIITKTAAQGITILNQWTAPDKPHLVKEDDPALITGIIVIPVYMAKGLEFDAVLIYEASNSNYHNASERQVLYVGCSRALHHLSLYSSDGLPPFIASIPAELYETNLFDLLSTETVK